MTVNLNTGTVRLVDRRTRVVEVLGPEPPGSPRPTDRELLLDTYLSMMNRPERSGSASRPTEGGRSSSSTRDRWAINCSTCSPDTPRPRRGRCGRTDPRVAWWSARPTARRLRRVFHRRTGAAGAAIDPRVVDRVCPTGAGQLDHPRGRPTARRQQRPVGLPARRRGRRPPVRRLRAGR